MYNKMCTVQPTMITENCNGFQKFKQILKQHFLKTYDNKDLDDSTCLLEDLEYKLQKEQFNHPANFL